MKDHNKIIRDSVTRSPFSTPPASRTGAAVACVIGVAYAGLFAGGFGPKLPDPISPAAVVAQTADETVTAEWGLEIRGGALAEHDPASLGQVITSQGNQAIQQIREDARLAMSPASMQPRFSEVAVAREALHVASVNAK